MLSAASSRPSRSHARSTTHDRVRVVTRGARSVAMGGSETAQLGYCECWMAGWERTCWRSREWIAAGAPNLA